MSGGVSEAGDAALTDVLGASRSISPRYNRGTRGRVNGERDGYGGAVGRDKLGYGRVEGGRTN